MLSKYFWMICVEVFVYLGSIGLWMEFLDWVGQEIFTVDSSRSWRDLKTDEHLLSKGRTRPLLLQILSSSDEIHLILSSFLMFLNSFGCEHWQPMASWQQVECWGSKVWVCCCYIWACPSPWLCCESPVCAGLVTCCCSPHFTFSHFKMFRWVSTFGYYYHHRVFVQLYWKNEHIFITKWI